MLLRRVLLTLLVGLLLLGANLQGDSNHFVMVQGFPMTFLETNEITGQTQVMLLGLLVDVLVGAAAIAVVIYVTRLSAMYRAGRPVRNE